MTPEERRERDRQAARIAVKRCYDGAGGSPAVVFEHVGGREGYQRLLKQALRMRAPTEVSLPVCDVCGRITKVGGVEYQQQGGRASGWYCVGPRVGRHRRTKMTVRRFVAAEAATAAA